MKHSESRRVIGILIAIAAALLVGFNTLPPGAEAHATESRPLATGLRHPTIAPDRIHLDASSSGMTNIGVVNLTYQGTSILWDSTASAAGSVKFGTTCGTSDSGLTEAGAADTGNGSAHLVQLANLSPATTYYYAVSTGGITDDNSGLCYSFKTLPNNGPTSFPGVAYGQVMTGSSCNTPLTSGIVTATDTSGSVTSLPNASSLGSQTSGASGRYAVNFSPTAAPDYSGFMQASPSDTITVKVDIGLAQASTQATWTGAATTLAMPQLCIQPVAAGVTASSPTITYGQGGLNPTFWTPTSPLCQQSGNLIPYCKPRTEVADVACSYSGLQSGVTGPAIPATGLTTAPPGAGLGTYPTYCSGAYDLDYTFSYTGGTLTVAPASLTIQADPIVVRRGSELPQVQWKANFVNGDSASSLRRQPACRSHVRTDARGRVVSRPGKYRIRCSGARDPNYAIRYRPAMVRVVKPPRLDDRQNG